MLQHDVEEDLQDTKVLAAVQAELGLKFERYLSHRNVSKNSELHVELKTAFRARQAAAAERINHTPAPFELGHGWFPGQLLSRIPYVKFRKLCPRYIAQFFSLVTGFHQCEDRFCRTDFLADLARACLSIVQHENLCNGTLNLLIVTKYVVQRALETEARKLAARYRPFFDGLFPRSSSADNQYDDEDYGKEEREEEACEEQGEEGGKDDADVVATGKDEAESLTDDDDECSLAPSYDDDDYDILTWLQWDSFRRPEEFELYTKAKEDFSDESDEPRVFTRDVVCVLWNQFFQENHHLALSAITDPALKLLGLVIENYLHFLLAAHFPMCLKWNRRRWPILARARWLRHQGAEGRADSFVGRVADLPDTIFRGVVLYL